MNETNRLMASVQAAKLSILAYPAFRFLHQKLHDAFVFDQVTEEGGTNVEIPGDMLTHWTWGSSAHSLNAHKLHMVTSGQAADGNGCNNAGDNDEQDAIIALSTVR
ncbi:hypothetical protein SCP_1301570 [Sparassis crispa]|uniref:Uncharacterized protein n=1 Tax=Sparassis crispa TaxID=139825 RepID=A0A401H1S3_9APHY|nr:hypothetical protein SCP_1301570 [Sparassis crispa]GBE88342.1 hypothetical protein SCP_1301570 [Sparassis crispa]